MAHDGGGRGPGERAGDASQAAHQRVLEIRPHQQDHRHRRPIAVGNREDALHHHRGKEGERDAQREAKERRAPMQLRPQPHQGPMRIEDDHGNARRAQRALGDDEDHAVARDLRRGARQYQRHADERRLDPAGIGPRDQQKDRALLRDPERAHADRRQQAARERIDERHQRHRHGAHARERADEGREAHPQCRDQHRRGARAGELLERAEARHERTAGCDRAGLVVAED